jgi:hypothetical protein
MPLIVLLVFYALHRVQHPPRAAGALPAAPAAAQSSPQP